MEIEYLGYVISPQGLGIDEEKIPTIKEWKEPTNVKGIQSLLGFANFYGHFIRNYSKITTPLSSLTRKEKGWERSDKQQEAFETLKKAMITEPILQHYDPERPVTIETDPSDYAIGAICSQPDEKEILHPVVYYSRKLKDPERNYNIHDKELTTSDHRCTTKMGYLLQNNGTQNHDSHGPQEPQILENEERPFSTASLVGRTTSQL